jgi:hypothetical protein
MATGGLLASNLSSFAFLREKDISATEMDNDKEGIFFSLKRFNDLQFYYTFTALSQQCCLHYH